MSNFLAFATVTAALQRILRPAVLGDVTGADVTLAADESVDLFFLYNGTARIEGHASSVVVVNGTADLVGGSVGNVIATSVVGSVGGGIPGFKSNSSTIAGPGRR